MLKVSVFITLLLVSSTALAQNTLDAHKPVTCMKTADLIELLKLEGEYPFIRFEDDSINTVVNITLNPDKGTFTVYEYTKGYPSDSCIITSGDEGHIFKPMLRYLMNQETQI